MGKTQISGFDDPKNCPPVREVAVVEDIIKKNDPNKSVEKFTSLEIWNGGSTIVRVNHKILLPDDRIEIKAPVGAHFPHQNFRIKFTGDFAFQKDLSTYPQLTSGNMLVFTSIEFIDCV